MNQSCKILGLARVPIRFPHMMTSHCSLPCTCTRVISKITPYSRQCESFQSNKTFSSFSKTRILFGLHTRVRCWLPSSLLGAGFGWGWLRLAADHPHVPVWQAPGGGSNGLHIGLFRTNQNRLAFDPRYRSAWRSCINLRATAATRLLTIFCIGMRP